MDFYNKKEVIKIKNKLKMLLPFFITSFLLFSCNTLVNREIINKEEKFSNVNNYIFQSKKNIDESIFDLGNKNGSSISIVVNSKKNEPFSAKSNTNGHTGKLKTDINLIRIYLVDSNASTLNGSNIKEGPFDITSASTGSLATFFTNVKGASGIGNLSFSNVGAGTYYVAVAAYSSSVTIDNTTNINSKSTTPAGSSTNITSGSDLGRFALSTTGGDSSNGVVVIGNMVSSGRAIYGLINNGTINLGVTLDLRDALGATIDSTTTITEGLSSIPSTTLQ